MSPIVPKWSWKDPETFLKAFSHGLAVQKGDTFGFGPTADVDTGSLLKISTISNEMMEKLEKIPIHNLAEEHSAKLFNYGIQIRGKNNLSTVKKLDLWWLRKILIKCFNNSYSQISITITDFQKVLSALNQTTLSKSKQTWIWSVSGQVIMSLHFGLIVVVNMNSF